MQLRPYQASLLSDARDVLRSHRSVLIQAPTGAGKTVIASAIVAGASRRGKRCIFAVHRRELVDQSMRTLTSLGLDVGVIAAGWPERRGANVYVASIQTLARRRAEHCDLLVVDECHHATSPTWRQVIDGRAEWVVGLSATPSRLDGRGLGAIFDGLVSGPSMRELIDIGALSEYRYFAPSTVDMRGARTSCGDYTRADAESAARTITGCAVDHYKKSGGRSAIAYCVNIAHSKATAERFLAAGVNAAHVDGTTPAALRDDIIGKFRSKHISVLCNNDLLCEGFDVPTADTAILLRPTKSVTLYLQQVGRVLRPGPGKVATILDHVGNVSAHGMPCEDRQWSLEGGVRSATREYESPISVCPHCFAAQRPGTTCRFCGAEMGKPSRLKSPEQIAGDLVELEIAKAARRGEVGRARTFEDLVAVGRARGYKNPVAWAGHVSSGRRRK